MKASLRTNDDPPGLADAVEGTDTSDDCDILLAKRYVTQCIFNSRQRKELRTIESDHELLMRATRIVELPEARQRNHPLYCEIRSNDERITVRNFMFFMQLTTMHVNALRGENGEPLRRQMQSALGEGEGQ
jgi:hypothetical protein